MSSYKESLQRAIDYDESLEASDTRFLHWVVITHAEGTTMTFASAFMMEDPDDPDYFWVFAEHQRLQVFPKEDVTNAVELAEVRRYRTAHGFAEDWTGGIVEGD